MVAFSTIFAVNLGYVLPVQAVDKKDNTKKPDILLAIYDDMTVSYMSAYGSKMVNTPNFDRIAKGGQLFMNAYVTAPSSSPSRASLLTGKYIGDLEQAGVLYSSFPKKFECYTDVFAANGYKIGYTGKGWAPGRWDVSGRKHNPAGPVYNSLKLTPPTSGIWNYDYFENFKKCLNERKKNQPFCFWYGAKESHRLYEKDSWKRFNKTLSQAEVPPFLPDSKEIRGDLLDYAVEVEWADKQLGKMLDYLKQIGELDNTFIVVMADNGMPFPAAKATCFESGCHVPMAMMWGNKIKKDKPIVEPVSSVDLSATFFDVAGIKYDKKIDGKSMLAWLEGKQKHNSRRNIIFGRERHGYVRPNGQSYPIRAIRENKFLYLYNFEPERWPAGNPWCYSLESNYTELIPSFGDIAESPSKTFIIENQNKEGVSKYFHHAVDKKPQEELYNLQDDPQCMNNLLLLNKSKYKEIGVKLHNKLFKQLKISHDNRIEGDVDVWDNYIFYSEKLKRHFTKNQ